MLAVLVVRKYGHWLTRVAVCEVAAVGFSRLYLGVHWLTAVLAGWLLAAAWLTLLFTSLQQFGPASRPLQRTRSI